jgi:hypothetical protein
VAAGRDEHVEQRRRPGPVQPSVAVEGADAQAARLVEPEGLELLRRRAEARWARLGLVREPGETWWEFCERARTPAMRPWVEAYCACRYGGAPLDEKVLDPEPDGVDVRLA